MKKQLRKVEWQTSVCHTIMHKKEDPTEKRKIASEPIEKWNTVTLQALKMNIVFQQFFQTRGIVEKKDCKAKQNQ